jgi:hypothetical protein
MIRKITEYSNGYVMQIDFLLPVRRAESTKIYTRQFKNNNKNNNKKKINKNNNKNNTGVS